MKKNVNYISRFVVNSDYVIEVKERLENLAEDIGEKESLKFAEREFHTNSKRKSETFNSVLYDYLELDKIYEVTTHCF